MTPAGSSGPLPFSLHRQAECPVRNKLGKAGAEIQRILVTDMGDRKQISLKMGSVETHHLGE